MRGAVVSLAAGAHSAPSMFVNLGNGVSSSIQDQIAVSVCSGLFNRNPDGPSAFLVWDSYDLDWVRDVDGVDTDSIVYTSASDFIKICLQGPANGYIRYNVVSQAENVPNLITVAAVLDAVPLEDDDPRIGSAPVVFDALKEFDGFSERDSTEYVYDHYANATTTMAKMNPGYNQTYASRHPVDPPLTGTINARLVDFIVTERLFNFFLVNGCVPGTDDHALFERMVADVSVGGGGWPRPIAVYGYDNSWPVAGDIFEAETDCAAERNLGQIASEGVTNLAYFNRAPPITEALPQNPVPAGKVYDPSVTYISVIMGDGDNVAFVRTSRRQWMLDRVAKCAADPVNGCFPLLWSISPHLLHVAPGWLRWYFNQSYATGSDYFVLPPSGDLYSYPGMMDGENAENFVTNTERDSTLLSTSASVHWEW